MKYKDVESLSLLKTVMEWVKQDGFQINNLDATIVAERPKLASHIPAMKECLSAVLKVQPDQVNIKATTTEGLGFCGQEQGIAAYSIVSLIQ
jgi:2-C-methyl-D-erythritol 2,4-cyclodiphosphate synthase